jgi:tRNA threonylcarbamoyl adenosine modification protein (Sua5/YciO/YrdC/YwlC family)
MPGGFCSLSRVLQAKKPRPQTPFGKGALIHEGFCRGSQASIGGSVKPQLLISMSQFFEIHPQNPQPRLLKVAAQILHTGGILAVPTDSSYAFVCHLDDKSAAENLRQLRSLNDKHLLTLLCRDLSELAHYARVDNRQYRLLKLGTPGPYTFILEATKEVPRRLSSPSRRTIGLRVPDHPITQALLEYFGQPLLATTLIPAGESEPLNDAHDIRGRYEKHIAAVIDAGPATMQPTTVIDLSSEPPRLLRQGAGLLSQLGLSAQELTG